MIRPNDRLNKNWLSKNWISQQLGHAFRPGDS
jgi:hypothetical protein